MNHRCNDQLALLESRTLGSIGAGQGRAWALLAVRAERSVTAAVVVEECQLGHSSYPFVCLLGRSRARNARTESLTCAFVFEADAAPPSVMGILVGWIALFVQDTAERDHRQRCPALVCCPPLPPLEKRSGRRRRRRAHPTNTPVPAAPAVDTGALATHQDRLLLLARLPAARPRRSTCCRDWGCRARLLP